ncbi:MAG TPA: R3H domain-containing nucleic acid-binding protein, partial [Micromonosporaceae bacterium]
PERKIVHNYLSERGDVETHSEGDEPDRRLVDAARDEEYPHAIWSAISLLRWGRQVGDAHAVDVATRYAPDMLDTVRGRPVRTSESVGRGFFSPVHLAVLLAADLGREDAADLAAPIAEQGLIDSDEMPTVHSAGLNFSRAWGTYAAWRATRDDDWRERYARLVLGHGAMPSRWRDDYDRYGHWIPQFGIFAIAESVDG